MAAVPPLFCLRGHEGAVNCVKFLAQGEGLCTGDVDGKLCVWNLENRAAVSIVAAAHGHSILSLSLAAAGQHLVSCGRDGAVKVWDLSSAAGVLPVTSLTTEARGFCNASTHQDAPDAVLTASEDESMVQLWDLRRGKVTSSVRLSSEHGMVSSLHLCNPTFGLAGCDDGSLNVVDFRGGSRALSSLKLHESEAGPQPLLAISARSLGDGRLSLMTGGGDAKLQRSIFAPLDGGGVEQQQLSVLDSKTIPTPGTSSIAHRCDGRIVASAHWDHTVRLHDCKRLKPLAVLRHHKDSVFAVAFGPQNTSAAALFASAGKDGLVAIWNLYEDKMKGEEG